MHYQEFAKQVLLGSNLEDKLLSPKDIEFDKLTNSIEIPNMPGRSERYKFDNTQIKFPKRPSFKLDEKRALALHFFANHELLAIEMMAAALLKYPTLTDADVTFKKGLVKTIQDEQKHFKLYTNRLKELGLEFGDFPLNDFFWRQMHDLKTPSHFYALMALTFESANLDFAKYYEECFKEVEDLKSAQIMRIVFEDEISHVALGAYWLNQWKNDKSLWEYFNHHLPNLITPARSKGIHFDKDSRARAGLDQEFISKVENYKDDFGVTNRRNW